MRTRTQLAPALALAAATFFAAPAQAVGEDEASATPKGTVGGALLGAELVLAVEAAIDVQPTYWYFVGGGAGAVAGGLGGYFLVDQNDDARASMLLLAGGLTLAIPTTVAVLSAAAYEPPADYLQDVPPADEPVADPPQPDGATPSPAAAPAPTSSREVRRQRLSSRSTPREPRRLDLTPPALLDIDPYRVAIAIPAVEVREVYTAEELFVFGVQQATEVRVPVLAVAF